MSHSRRKYLKIAGSTALGIGIAGCQGGGDVTGGEGPITIGATIAKSGPYAKTASYSLEAFKLWSEQVNKNGGLLGREVEWQIYDDQSDPQTAAQLYRKLIREDNVDLLFGPFGSPVAKATAPIQEQAGYATINPMASDSSIWTENDYEYVFQGIGIASNYIRGFVRKVAEKGANSIAFAHPDTSFPTAATDGAITYAEEEDMEVLSRTSYPRGEANYSQIASELTSQEPDVVAGGGYFPDAVGLTRAFRSIGYNADAYAFYTAVASGDFYNTLDSVANGISGNTAWNPRADTKGNQSFIKAYQNKWGRSPDYHSAGNYAAGQVLQTVVEEVGEINQDAIKKKLSNKNPKSVYGTWDVNEDTVQVGYSHLIIQWQNGKQEIIAPESAATADMVYPAPTWSEK